MVVAVVACRRAADAGRAAQLHVRVPAALALRRHAHERPGGARQSHRMPSCPKPLCVQPLKLKVPNPQAKSLLAFDLCSIVYREKLRFFRAKLKTVIFLPPITCALLSLQFHITILRSTQLLVTVSFSIALCLLCWLLLWWRHIHLSRLKALQNSLHCITLCCICELTCTSIDKVHDNKIYNRLLITTDITSYTRIRVYYTYI